MRLGYRPDKDLLKLPRSTRSETSTRFTRFASALNAGDARNDLADASLIVAAETLTTRKVFTVDRKDCAAYRVRRGHRHYAVEIIP